MSGARTCTPTGLRRAPISALRCFTPASIHLTKTFEHLGFSHYDAAQHAQGMLYNQLNQQASLIGFMDCFRMMAVVALIGIPLALATKSFRPGGEASGGH